MRIGQLLDPIAQRLLELRTVSTTQWQLRLLGAVSTLLALALAIDVFTLLSHAGSQLLLAVVVIALVLHCRRPDRDLGLVAPGAILLAVVVQDGVTMLETAGVGAALLLAHSAFALAATLPVHGEFGRDAWRLAGSVVLVVLMVSVVASVLIVLLSTVQFGAWMMVVGALATIGLLVAVLPRAA